MEIVRGPSVTSKQFPSELLARCPAASVQEAEGELVGEEAAGGAFQTEVAGALVALLGFRQGVAFSAGQLEDEGHRHVGANDGFGVSYVLGDAAASRARAVARSGW